MRSENRSPNQNTRRTFLKSTGAMAAGLYLTRTASAQGNALAVHGGAKAVTASHDDATAWPRYGTEEEQAVLELVRNPNYGPIEALEQEWKKQFNLPYCKAHYNGTSAITAMFFALDQNRLLFNEAEAGMSRAACLKALKAEGVSVGAAGAQFQGHHPAYHEAQWWHHLPIIAERFPGVEEVNRRGISLPYFTKDVPELIDQYIQAFEKVWAHRQELA